MPRSWAGVQDHGPGRTVLVAELSIQSKNVVNRLIASEGNSKGHLEGEKEMQLKDMWLLPIDSEFNGLFQ